MSKRKLVILPLMLGGVLTIPVLHTGCGTTSTSHGASMGAVLGGMVGGIDGAATGALLGGGVGYLDDRATDKQIQRSQKERELARKEREARMEEARITNDPKTAYRPEKDSPLTGTSWRVISFVSEDEPAPEYHSMVVTFTTNSRLTTLTVWDEGKTETVAERYTLIDDVMIIRGKDYVVNAKYTVEDDQMVVLAPGLRLVLEKV